MTAAADGAPAPLDTAPVDLAIVGGGMVGACLALALAEPLAAAGRRLLLLESAPPDSGRSPSFDGRTTALSNGSRRILDALGVWDAVAAEAAPITRIHVSDRGRFGAARLDAAEQGLAAMGYVMPNRVLGAALWSRLSAHPGVQLRAPVRVTGVEADGEVSRLSLDDGSSLAARLVVAADGAQSLVRQTAGIAATVEDYGQVAVITQVTCDRAHGGAAYERFTVQGPIAVLPLPPSLGTRRVATVWTLTPAEAERVRALPEAAFLAELQVAFGWRLGRFTGAGERLAYPLSLVQSTSLTAPRLAIIGNAAQGLHPIAGQGFNLGLRDAVTLAECVVDALAGDPFAADPGAPAVLERYARWRADDRRLLVRFTDGLVKLFGAGSSAFGVARGLGLSLFDLLPPAKAALSTLSTVVGTDHPRLARGLPVYAPSRMGVRP